MDSSKKKTNYLFLLILLIAFQTFLLILIFAVKKTSYHQDEFFSYAYSNSYYRTYLYGSEYKVTDNINVWQTGEDFKYYIETNDSTAFKYDSVWFNTGKDFTPPLYYVILHTISSVFKNNFSWLWAFSINLFCFVVTQAYLFRLAKRVFKNEVIAIIPVAFYGFTLGAQNTFLFLRPYAMFTMFCIIYSYYSSDTAFKDKIGVIEFAKICLSSFLGAMTQHFFLIFAFIVTLCECISMFFHKKVKSMLLYGSSALIGVLLSFAAFPATIKHMVISENIYGENFSNYRTRVWLFSRPVIRDVFGIYPGYYEEDLSVIPITFFAIIGSAIVFAAILWLYRSTKWGKHTINTLKTMGRKVFFWMWGSDHIIIFSFLGSLGIFLVTAHITNYNEVREEAMRYYMPLFLFTSLFFFSLLFSIIKIISYRKEKVYKIGISVCTLLLCGLLAFQNIVYEPAFAGTSKTDNGRISEYITNKNGILIINSSIFLPCLSEAFSQTGKVRITSVYPTIGFRSEDEQVAESELYNEEFYVAVASNYLRSSNIENTPENNPSGLNSIDELIKYYENESGKKATYITTEYFHNGGYPLQLYFFS